MGLYLINESECNDKLIYRTDSKRVTRNDWSPFPSEKMLLTHTLAYFSFTYDAAQADAVKTFFICVNSNKEQSK